MHDLGPLRPYRRSKPLSTPICTLLPSPLATIIDYKSYITCCIQTGQSSIASFPVHHPTSPPPHGWTSFFFFLLLPPSSSLHAWGARHDRFHLSTHSISFPLFAILHSFRLIAHTPPSVHSHHFGILLPDLSHLSLSATSRISTTIMYIHAYTHRIGLLYALPVSFCLDRRLLHYRI